MKKNERGSAMIAVLCVMAVAAVMALTLLRSAVTVSRFGKRDQKEQCRILAVSLSECLAAAVEQMEYECAAAGENGEDEEAEDVVPAWIPQTEFLEHLERIAADGSELELRLEDDSGLPGTAVVTVWIENDEENPFPEKAVLCMRVTVFMEEDSYALASRFVFEETEAEDEDMIEILDEEGEGTEGSGKDEREDESGNDEENGDKEKTESGRNKGKENKERRKSGNDEENRHEERSKSGEKEENGRGERNESGEKEENGNRERNESGSDGKSGDGEEYESGDEWENEYRTGHWKYDGRITDAG